MEVCTRCGGPLRVVACIEDQVTIPDKAGQALDRILTHHRDKEQICRDWQIFPEILRLFNQFSRKTCSQHAIYRTILWIQLAVAPDL